MVESVDDAIICQNLKGTITHWSAAAQRMFEYTAHERVGASAMEIVPTALHGVSNALLTRLYSGHTLEWSWTHLLHKDGGSRHVLSRMVPTHGAAGDISGAMRIAKDVAARERAMARIKHVLRAYPSIALSLRLEYGDRLAELLLKAQNDQRASVAGIVSLTRYTLISDALGAVMRDDLLCITATRLLHPGSALLAGGRGRVTIEHNGSLQ